MARARSLRTRPQAVTAQPVAPRVPAAPLLSLLAAPGLAVANLSSESPNSTLHELLCLSLCLPLCLRLCLFPSLDRAHPRSGEGSKQQDRHRRHSRTRRSLPRLEDSEAPFELLAGDGGQRCPARAAACTAWQTAGAAPRATCPTLHAYARRRRADRSETTASYARAAYLLPRCPRVLSLLLRLLCRAGQKGKANPSADEQWAP
mmetsp:Transcript_42909/g.89630  ORF Transcript_42909/g.89630 Transcript_42909/m.89630 type:complete len:204 (+) Transcript_42909:471-1082(+)